MKKNNFFGRFFSKKFMFVYSLIFFFIILLLLYNFNSHVLSFRERHLRTKMFEEIDRINYCDVNEDCTVGCIWDVSNAGCGTPYFYNVDESNKKVERYRSKISNLVERRGEYNPIDCLVNFCQEAIIHELYHCENNVCLKKW